MFDASGRLVYHGRIDDRYVDFGVDRRGADHPRSRRRGDGGVAGARWRTRWSRRWAARSSATARDHHRHAGASSAVAGPGPGAAAVRSASPRPAVAQPAPSPAVDAHHRRRVADLQPGHRAAPARALRPVPPPRRRRPVQPADLRRRRRRARADWPRSPPAGSCRRGRPTAGRVSSSPSRASPPTRSRARPLGEGADRRAGPGAAAAALARRVVSRRARSRRDAARRLHAARRAERRLPHLRGAAAGDRPALRPRHRVPSRQRPRRAPRQHPHRSHATVRAGSTRPIVCRLRWPAGPIGGVPRRPLPGLDPRADRPAGRCRPRVASRPRHRPGGAAAHAAERQAGSGAAVHRLLLQRHARPPARRPSCGLARRASTSPPATAATSSKIATRCRWTPRCWPCSRTRTTAPPTSPARRRCPTGRRARSSTSAPGTSAGSTSTATPSRSACRAAPRWRCATSTTTRRTTRATRRCRRRASAGASGRSTRWATCGSSWPPTATPTAPGCAPKCRSR